MRPGGDPPLLTLDRVSRVFELGSPRLFGRRPRLQAVSDVSLQLGAQEAFGLVGESGCGKSTLGRMVAGLIEPTAGEILLNGESRSTMRAADRERWALGVQMIFQNPGASLNPRLTIRETLREPLRVHGIASRFEVDHHVDRLLGEVGFDPRLAERRPHELSGGQCQRVGIARALSVAPTLLVCDEPVSALDVSIQAQVLNLLADLRERRPVSYFFISHDLGVVERVSDTVGVMYLGRLVEVAPTQALFARPQHPYTRLLLDSIPRFDAGFAEAASGAGEQPSPLAPPQGCRFHGRCPLAIDICRRESPPLVEVSSGHRAACHLVRPQA